MFSSHCLLAMYNIASHEDLGYLMEFGWKAIQYQRIALVLKMAPGLTLKSEMNLTKLPFMIAAELENGDVQYICPHIGDAEPRQQDFMCRKSYVLPENKTLRVGMMGQKPYFVGEPILVFVRISLHAKQCNFQYQIVTYYTYSKSKWTGWNRFQVAKVSCCKTKLRL